MSFLPSTNPSDEPVTPSEQSSFGDILSQFEQQHHSEGPNRALEGTVIAVTSESVFVDIGRKTEGSLKVEDLRKAGEDAGIQPGTKIFVTVAGRTEEGYYSLSLLKVERPKDWSSLEKAFADKTAIAGTVTEVVKGGLRVDVGVPAFMPASRSGTREAAEMEKLVGQEIRCRIIKLDVADEDVVVDRRAILEEEEIARKRQFFEGLAEGAVVTGTVRSLTDFGAFVDLGGVDGLLHVTDMSWGRVNKPADVLKAGDSVEVKILKINRETRRVSLGMKQLVPDPWTVAAEKYKVGDRVRGKVARITDFGAFIELDPGVDGLIHLSEMSWSRKTRKPSDVVTAGEQVEVVVLGVNIAERRIALGLKQALGDPWDEAVKRYTPGSVVEGPISNLAKFGAFVDLGDGVEGMIHIGDITREKRLNTPNEMLTVGQTVRAQVLELDREKRRIRLSMKLLEPTTADEYIAEHNAGEVVSGRILDVSGRNARIELGQGVQAQCRLPEARSAQAAAADRQADISSLTAKLAARWKGEAGGSAGGGAAEPVRPGQVRSFRITSLDPAQKRIDIELAE